MQTVRSNITRLRNQIESVLPDSGDILDFPGVTRAGLIQLMESASAESYDLIANEDDFEVVLLKRKVAGPIESCREYLSDFKGGKRDKRNFDDFVRALTDIRDQIRLTYLICHKSGLRSEDMIQRAKESLGSLLDTKEQLQSEVNELLVIRDDLKVKLDSVATADSAAQEHLESIEGADSDIESMQSKSAAAFEVITKYEQQITEARESANENAAAISTLVNKGDKAVKELEKADLALTNITNKTAEQQKKCNELNQEISQTLAAANRVGMAGSFHSRKSELGISLIIWGLCFGASIAGILGISLWLILPYIKSTDSILTLEAVGLKVLVVAPLVWFAWMSARQYGYVARIREDYSFKYATAMAFEGYKKEAQEIDESLLQQLMLQAIDAVGQNPIRLYGKDDNHASPVHEVVDKILEAVKRNGNKSQEQK